MCGGGCVSRFSRTQKCVTLSTMEAVYVAMADVLKEVLFLRQVWRFMLPGSRYRNHASDGTHQRYHTGVRQKIKNEMI